MSRPHLSPTLRRTLRRDLHTLVFVLALLVTPDARSSQEVTASIPGVSELASTEPRVASPFAPGAGELWTRHLILKLRPEEAEQLRGAATDGFSAAMGA
jgi:hypothetical protein